MKKTWKKPKTSTLDQEGRPVKGQNVIAGRMPSWLRANLHKRPFFSQMLQGVRIYSWMDHTGSSFSSENERIWVCEPHHLGGSAMEQILGFADVVGAHVSIKPIADWNPCHCIRIEFSQK